MILVGELALWVAFLMAAWSTTVSFAGGAMRRSDLVASGERGAYATFAFVLLKYGLAITERVATQTAPSTRVSMAWLYGAMPAGAALIFLNALAIIADDFSGKKDTAA